MKKPIFLVKCKQCGGPTSRISGVCRPCTEANNLLEQSYRKRKEFYHPYKLSSGKTIHLNENAACPVREADKLTEAEWEEYEHIPALRQRRRREGMSWQEFLLAKEERVL